MAQSSTEREFTIMLREYLISTFFDPNDGYMVDCIQPLGIKVSAGGVVTFPDGKKYRIGLVPVEPTTIDPRLSSELVKADNPNSKPADVFAQARVAFNRYATEFPVDAEDSE